MMAQRALRGLGWLTLLLLLSPIAYACWVSFTPGELLVPPTGHWSLRWYREFFADRRWRAALENSFAVAGLPRPYHS